MDGPGTDGSRYASAPRPVTGPEDVAADLDHAEAELARAVRGERRRPQPAAGRTTTVDVGGGDITGHLRDSWHFVGNTIIVPNEFWELPSGTSSCLITALIAAEDGGGYDYAVTFEDANNFHYRMSAGQAKHLATKQMKKLARGAQPKPIEPAH